MSECIIDFSSLKIESRPKPVFYATDDFIIYKDGHLLKMDNCEGKTLSQINCPLDYRVYECLDLGDEILFIFAGKYLVMFDKVGNEPIAYALDMHKIGKVITKLLPSPVENCIFFGTTNANKIQFMNYDFVQRKKVFQSSSWEAKQINDIVLNSCVYALLDQTLLVSLDTETCATKWKRIETGGITPKLLPYDKELIYLVQNVIRKYKERKSTVVRTTLTMPTSLLGIRKDEFYFTTNFSNIHAWNISQGKLKWEIQGNSPIRQSLMLKGIHGDDKVHDMMALRLDGHLVFINLDIGQTAYYSKQLDILRIRKTGNHLLIHKQGSNTDMIAGIEND